jgi:hypothetical protein
MNSEANKNQDDCSNGCYLKLFNNSRCLIEAVLRMYETSSNFSFSEKYQKNKIFAKDHQANQSADNLNFEKLRKVRI